MKKLLALVLALVLLAAAIPALAAAFNPEQFVQDYNCSINRTYEILLGEENAQFVQPMTADTELSLKDTTDSEVIYANKDDTFELVFLKDGSRMDAWCDLENGELKNLPSFVLYAPIYFCFPDVDIEELIHFLDDESNQENVTLGSLTMTQSTIPYISRTFSFTVTK